MLSSKEYEQLTRQLVERICKYAPASTTKVECDIVLQGRATRHQVDVLWEFTAAGTAHRVLIECRRYRSALKQKDVFAFKGIVDDLATPGVVTTGVMVTATGYQKGAQAVADTYGVFILELRQPTEVDLKDRVVEIRVTITSRMPVVRDFEVRAIEPVDASKLIKAWGPDVELEIEGQRRTLINVMLDGELAPLGQPATPDHRVLRRFEPAALLLIEGRPVFLVTAVAATVGEREADPFDITVEGRKRLAWMVKDTLGGTHAWFNYDGQFHITN